MNLFFLFLIAPFLNQFEYTVAQQNAMGSYSIPKAIAGHCSDDAVQSSRRSLSFYGFFVPCNDDDLLFFYDIRGTEYDKPKERFIGTERIRTYGTFYFLIDRNCAVTNPGLNKMNTPGQVRFVNDPLDPQPVWVLPKNERILAKQHTPTGIRLQVDPERTPPVRASRVPARFSLVSESPLRFRFTEGDVSKEFSVKENDGKFWFGDGEVRGGINHTSYSKDAGALYIVEHGGISESNAEEIDYLLDYTMEARRRTLGKKSRPGGRMRKRIEEKLAGKYRFRYSIYNAFRHDETYELDLPAPLRHFTVTDRKEVLALAVNGKLYLDGKEVYSFQDDPVVRARPSDLPNRNGMLFLMVFFRKDHVLFFSTYFKHPSRTPGADDAFIVKYDLTSGTSSLLYSASDDTALQRWMDRVAEKRNMDALSFEIEAILRHYFNWGFYYPAIRFYNTITH